MNPDPLTVSGNTAPPALVNAGEMPLIAGTGFVGILIVNAAVATALVE
jgi:hypothetical protein